MSDTAVITTCKDYYTTDSKSIYDFCYTNNLNFHKVIESNPDIESLSFEDLYNRYYLGILIHEDIPNSHGFIGMTFGNFLVVDFINGEEPEDLEEAKYYCICKICGTPKIISKYTLLDYESRGNVCTCSELDRLNSINMPEIALNTAFKNTFIMNKSDIKNKYGDILYNCKCLRCGNHFLARIGDIFSGRVNGCNCIDCDTCGKSVSYDDVINNYINKRFGDLIVKDVIDRDIVLPHSTMRWLCVCTRCNTVVEKFTSELYVAQTYGLGCGNCITVEEDMVIYSELIDVYKRIRSKCFNSNDLEYHNYGKKGISMYRDWIMNYTSFTDWAIAEGFSINCDVELIDPSKDFGPDNCKIVHNRVDGLDYYD